MLQASTNTEIETWLDEEAAMRRQLAAPGVLPLSALGTMSPADVFNGIGNGTLPHPPFGSLVDFVPIRWEPGRFIFQGTPDTRHYNPLGTVHGGYAATLLDSCMGCAIHTRLEQGQGYTTLDLRVSYLRALRDGVGPVRAEGTVVHIGRSTATAEGQLYDAEGRLYATGSTTCLIFQAPKQRPAAGE